MTDILTWMLPDPVWAATEHLETSTGLPVYTTEQGGVIWIMKGHGGYPWDAHKYDDNYVYNAITDASPVPPATSPNSWTNPKQFKAWASSSTPNGGIYWSRRQIADGLNVPSRLVTPDSTYRTYTDCTHYMTQNLGGSVEVSWLGPVAVPFGGDVKTQEALIQFYKWGAFTADYAVCEVNYYVKGFGLVRWESWALDSNGVYALAQTSAYHLKKAGGVPVPVFPCGMTNI